MSHLTTTFSRYLNEAFYVTHHPHPTFNASGATLPVFNSPAILSRIFCEECTLLAGICGLPGICWFPYPKRYPRWKFCTRCPERTDMDRGPQAFLKEQEGGEARGPNGAALILNCREKQMQKLFPQPLLAECRARPALFHRMRQFCGNHMPPIIAHGRVGVVHEPLFLLLSIS